MGRCCWFVEGKDDLLDMDDVPEPLSATSDEGGYETKNPFGFIVYLSRPWTASQTLNMPVFFLSGS